MIELIGVGGALGAMSRYYLSQKIKLRHDSFYPLETFCVNLLGAILLGFVIEWHFSTSITAFLGDGFLGAFTTFSTFMLEGYGLLNKHVGKGVWYIVITFVLGLFGYGIGYLLAAIL